MPDEWWELAKLVLNVLLLIAWWMQHRPHN
jgi:hypothetical protein